MGRKVNPLISEHFERGAKLKDNSNRYQHTCKACGEHFPKGRFEVLLGHVLKRCPSIGSERRRQLVYRYHDLELSDRSSMLNNGQALQQYATNSASESDAVSVNGYNRLRLLAEASQSVESGECPALRRNTRIGDDAHQSVPLDPTLDVDSFTSVFLNIPDDNMEARAGSPLHSSPPPLSSSFSTASTLVEHPSLRTPTSSATEPTLSVLGVELKSIAASANDIMRLDSDFELSHPSIADDLLLDKPVVAAAVPLADASSAQELTPSEASRLLGTSFPQPALSEGRLSSSGPPQPLPRLGMHTSPQSAHFIPETGTPTRAMKPKVRGKFTPERRKEVKNIRQMGACIRCRMLKKTCSGGDPCQACAAIDNPRVWKRRCVRTKLVDEFTLFAVGLQSTLAFLELASIRENTNSEPFDGYIQASHFDHETTSISLGALRLTQKCSDSITGIKSSISPSPKENDCGLAIVSSESFERTFDSQIDSYFSQIHESLIDAELSPVLKSTLQTALTLLSLWDDPLLARTSELWSKVLILVDPEFSFKLVARPGPITDHGTICREFAAPGLPLTPVEWPQSSRIINVQLRAFLEKRTALLAKGIIGDLERRLMEKPHNNQFRTFIIAVVLMNCVERMSWLYGRWAKLREASWPLEKRPEQYAQEGDTFASILDGLLELRNIPPKTVVDPIQKIIVPEDATDEVVREWFEKIAVTPEMLRTVSDRSLDVTNCRCMDMKLFARWIRPSRPAMKKELV